MARIISKEEADKIGLRPIGKKHRVRVYIENMKVTDNLHVTRAEFTWKKRTPLIFIRQIEKSTSKKFRIYETMNRLGWVVVRLE